MNINDAEPKLDPRIAEIKRRQSAATTTKFDVFWKKRLIPSFLSPYCKAYEPFEPHFCGDSGLFWPYDLLRMYIEKHRRDLADMPTLKQIKEIGLEDEFRLGTTRYQVPGTLYAKRDGWMQ